MDSKNRLIIKIQRLEIRLRKQRFLQWSCYGGICGGILGIFLVLASHLGWIRIPTEFVFIGLVLFILLSGLFGYFKKISPLEVAKRADETLDLKERLSSALEFINTKYPRAMVSLQIEDANKHSEKLNTKEIFPYKWPRGILLFAAAVLVLAGIQMIPEIALFQSPLKRAERTLMKEQGQSLMQAAIQIQKETPKDSKNVTAQLAENMRLLGKDMVKNRLTKKEALLNMHKLNDQVEKAEQKLYNESAERRINDATRDMQNLTRSIPPSAENSELKQLAQEMVNALQKHDFKKADQLAKQAEKLHKQGKLSEQNLQKMNSALRQAKSQGALDSGKMQKMAKAMRIVQGKMQSTQCPCCHGTGRDSKTGKLCKACNGRGVISDGMDAFSSSGVVKGRNDLPTDGMGVASSGISIPNAGHGTTNLKIGKGGEMGNGYSLKRQQAGEKPDMRAKFQQVYDPHRIHTTPLGTKVQGTWGNQGVVSSEKVLGAPDKATAQSGYADVGASYQHVREKAIEKENIPPAYKTPVKNYFESLR